MNFREKIKEICASKNMTQKDLAEKLGITDISLNKTLRGKYPALQTLEKIATALGIDITELFNIPPDNTVICPRCGERLNVKFM